MVASGEVLRYLTLQRLWTLLEMDWEPTAPRDQDGRDLRLQRRAHGRDQRDAPQSANLSFLSLDLQTSASATTTLTINMRSNIASTSGCNNVCRNNKASFAASILPFSGAPCTRLIMIDHCLSCFGIISNLSRWTTRRVLRSLKKMLRFLGFQCFFC